MTLLIAAILFGAVVLFFRHSKWLARFVERQTTTLPKQATNGKKANNGCLWLIIMFIILAILCKGCGESSEQRCARQRIDELRRRTALEQHGVDTGSSDPLDSPCH